MPSYWIDFTSKPSGCVHASSPDAAKTIATEKVGEVKAVRVLPYQAEPQITKFIDPKYGEVPAFCFEPRKCAGRTSCPQNYSCTE